MGIEIEKKIQIQYLIGYEILLFKCVRLCKTAIIYCKTSKDCGNDIDVYV